MDQNIRVRDTHLLNSDDDSMQGVTAEGVVVPVVAEGVVVPVVTEGVVVLVVTEGVAALVVMEEVAAPVVAEGVEFDGVGEGEKKVDEFDEGSDGTCVDEEAINNGDVWGMGLQ